MSRGYVGRLLFVDLTNGEIVEEPLDEAMCRDFLGGYGLGARILYDRMSAGAEPLGPENILGFLTGPLTGTEALQANRFVVVCKSPLTGGWGDANAGGNFGPTLKFSGYDGVFFSGAAGRPVYLLIEDGKAEIKDASDLWGKDCYEIDDIFKERYGADAESAVIGPAGERQALISCIVTDKGRAAGRSGVGAVMGAKNLKALVVKGSRRIQVADGERVKALRKHYMANPGSEYKRFQEVGTIGLLQSSAETGDSPVKNWRGSGWEDFEGGIKKFNNENIFAYKTGRYGCWRCNISCGGHMQVQEGPHEGTWAHQVEYESACAFGTLCLIDDLASLIKSTEIVNKFGLDSISTGCAVAFAMDCYEAGILNKEDTGGLELTWGNAEAMIALTEQMAAGEGLGGILSQGVKVAAGKIGKGAEQFAIHAGGQEVPMHDPRFFPGLATAYQMDATPARHTQGGELLPPVDWDIAMPNRFEYSGKSEVLKKTSALLHVVQAAGLCLFGYLSYPVDFLPEFLTAVTGWDYDLDDCYLLGERIANMRHAFNLREGINPIIDYALPGIVVGDPPLTEGDLAGITVDVGIQRDEYCQAMGWDPTTSRPSLEKLSDLNLDFLAEDIAAPA